MCVPGTQEAMLAQLSRRGFLKAAAGLMGGALIPSLAGASPVLARKSMVDEAEVTGRPFSRVVDLTHTITFDFPTYFGDPNLEFETLFTFEENGFNMFRWLLVEHTGTHMDAPFHFSPDQDTADEIPISKLVIPLAVIDIRRKADENPDAQVTLDDLIRWEQRFGRIPAGACVAMNSGWADKVHTDEFRNADENGVLHFPGFHIDAAAFLMEERDVNGIAVDTLSLDYGPSPDFATHYLWLGSNRWGIEALANLDLIPPRGATLIAGGPKIAGATGGISRCLALVHEE